MSLRHRRVVPLAATVATLTLGTTLAPVGDAAIASTPEPIPVPPPIDSTEVPGVSREQILREREIDRQQWEQIMRELPPMDTPSVATGGGTGATGEVWVSLVMNSGSSAFAGHAAIVGRSPSKTIESFAKALSPVGRDGVVRLDNTWGTRGKVLRLGVVGSSSSKRTAAASWSEGQIGKPYNFNFFDKNTEAKFYCSQLVWKAWLKQGIDIEKGSIPNGAVTPADLVNSTNTTINYRA